MACLQTRDAGDFLMGEDIYFVCWGWGSDCQFKGVENFKRDE